MATWNIFQYLNNDVTAVELSEDKKVACLSLDAVRIRDGKALIFHLHGIFYNWRFLIGYYPTQTEPDTYTDTLTNVIRYCTLRLGFRIVIIVANMFPLDINVNEKLTLASEFPELRDFSDMYFFFDTTHLFENLIRYIGIDMFLLIKHQMTNNYGSREWNRFLDHFDETIVYLKCSQGQVNKMPVPISAAITNLSTLKLAGKYLRSKYGRSFNAAIFTLDYLKKILHKTDYKYNRRTRKMDLSVSAFDKMLKQADIHERLLP